MKRLCALLMTAVLLFCCAAQAEEESDYAALTADELIEIIEQRDATIADLEAQLAALESDNESANAAPAVLEVGSEGDDVQALQERLKELGYLDGSADGIYGNATAGAVSAFQIEAGIAETGAADEATQAALFADDAPRAQIYFDLDYTQASRDPDAYEGTLIKFDGTIVQVMESDTLIVFRVATDGRYDDIVYCIYERPEDYTRFLEDDRVNIWGISTGVYTYTAVMGNEITIPSCYVERIELR